MIDRFYPSSKQCHRCFELHEDLGLQDRVWTCALCRTTHDRDYNAAKNIERVGASKTNFVGYRCLIPESPEFIPGRVCQLL